MLQRIDRVLDITVNRGVAWWGSTYGVLVTAVVCTGGHLAFTLTGEVKGGFQHWVLALSEIALLMAAMILHASITGDAATQLKLDVVVGALDKATNAAMGADALPKAEVQRLRDEALGQVRATVRDAVDAPE